MAFSFFLISKEHFKLTNEPFYNLFYYFSKNFLRYLVFVVKCTIVMETNVLGVSGGGGGVKRVSAPQ